MARPTRASFRAKLIAGAAAAGAAGIPPAMSAQSERGLYIAGDGFTFQQAASHGIAQNPGGRRFFLLSLPPETNALASTATGAPAAVRDRVIAAGGVLLVCQRDIDSGKLNASNLMPGVVAVRGWPSVGSAEATQGGRYFAGENPANLPASNEALRRLRSICAY
jgi:hypothetical protein